MKLKTMYRCQECGHTSPKWMGRCPDCSSWNSFAEEAPTSGRVSRAAGVSPSAPVRLDEVPGAAEERRSCGIAELDRVLGGGLVPGSVILIGGDPGIGKSTLVLQAMNHLARQGGPSLYVTGEESARQTRLRGERLHVRAHDLFLLPETSLEQILHHVSVLKPNALVVDSIQTMYTSAVESAPGSVSQVRECAGKLLLLAKGTGIPVFIIGHVTKEGSLAGPRVLEHLVDTVLYFEGNAGHSFRILRAVKNRFGSTNEIGVFEMQETGLVEVTNPSEFFLTERPLQVSGSVVTATMEGTRPLLVELQALVSASSFGVPRRTTIGIDHNRLALLVAVLEKKVGLSLGSSDIYLNAAGGVRVFEPAADLGIVVAVASSHLDRIVDPGTVLFGEVGLAGEVRGIADPEGRVREAAKLGFSRCILPPGGKTRARVEGIETVEARNVAEALEAAF